MEIAVIGGGASGMMAAAQAALSGNNVTLYEKNEKHGKKLYITGKGRCNVTNACSADECLQNVVNGKKFLYSALYAFPPEKTMEMLEKLGVKLKIERGNRVFPFSDKSSDIISALTKSLKNAGVKTVFEAVLQIEKSECGFIVVTDWQKKHYDKVILACGGISYPATGSTGDGYVFAQKLGHTIVKPRAALVPLILNENVKPLQGLSLRNVTATVTAQGKTQSLFGEMLFTDSGVSGPIILSLSSLVGTQNLHAARLCIDLKPALDEEKLDKRVLSDFSQFKNKRYKNSLSQLLPSKLIDYFIRYTGIDPEKEINSITKAERNTIVRALKGLKFTIKSAQKAELGIITAGGISLSEINPKTMQSKITPGLFFAGEMMDVDALTGGFNLQIAFATGYVAGKYAGE